VKLAAVFPFLSWAAPLAGWLLLAGVAAGYGGPYLLLVAVGLIACVLEAVHHAEVVAARVGEPYGTLILAIAITVIEVALIVALMLAGGPAASALARDTVFAAVMIILNGIVGLCLLLGATRHLEQAFGLYGTNAALTTLAAIAVLTMIIPNYTATTPGPYYSAPQLAFISVVSLVLYGTFVLMQTVRHRGYFLPVGAPGDETAEAPIPPLRAAWVSGVLLLACLGAVVLSAKALAPSVEAAVRAAGAPQALVGIIIATVVLMPEGYAALRAARANRLQTSLNLALGSALASIGLSIPAVAILTLTTGEKLMLGLDAMSTALLLLSLFIASLSLSTGRTTVMQGAVHLVLFAVYLFITIFP
jgi:Ca2+:H+ antiporter